MKRKIEVLPPEISSPDCPLGLTRCKAEWMPTSCEHWRGVLILKSGYVGIVCSAALEEEGDDGSPEVGVEALQSSLRDGECGELPTGD